MRESSNLPLTFHKKCIISIIMYILIILILMSIFIYIPALIYLWKYLIDTTFTYHINYNSQSNDDMFGTTPFTCSAVCNCVKASVITILPILTINAISRHGAYDSARNKFDKQCECDVEKIECDESFVRIKCFGICDDIRYQRKDECKLIILQHILIPTEHEHMKYNKHRSNDDEILFSYLLQEYNYKFNDDLIYFCSKNNCNNILYGPYNSDKRCEYEW